MYAADEGICSDEGRIRLVGGQTQFEGRVEICLDGVWGTVCDDSWHITASEVVCRQIEIQSGYEILSESIVIAYVLEWSYTCNFMKAKLIIHNY